MFCEKYHCCSFHNDCCISFIFPGKAVASNSLDVSKVTTKLNLASNSMNHTFTRKMHFFGGKLFGRKEAPLKPLLETYASPKLTSAQWVSKEGLAVPKVFNAIAFGLKKVNITKQCLQLSFHPAYQVRNWDFIKASKTVSFVLSDNNGKAIPVLRR